MFLINNIYWKLAFVEPNYPLLIKYDGNYSIGACDNLTRTIYINNTLTGNLLKKVLCHQLTHAAMFSYGVILSPQQEELVADLISTYGEEIIYTTNKIFVRLSNV